MQKNTEETRRLMTRWAEKMDRNCPLNDYPRPQLRRENWICLNGPWQYAVCGGDKEPEKWDGDILVPFSPEALLSGAERQLLPGQVLWYRRTVRFAGPGEDRRLLLHFGAVDQCCTVYINGKEAGSHSGGYWPFCFDITGLVCEGENVLTVSVTDVSDTGLQAYGKQKLKRGGIWYTAQSGIWQTVWAEYVPRGYIEYIRITPDCRESAADFYLALAGDAQTCPECSIRIFDGDRLVSEERFSGNSARLRMDGFRYWSPDDPFLYTVRITAGRDTVESYFGMREFSAVRDTDGHLRISINGKPFFHSGLLDQGYWSDGLYTAPHDEAMIWEIGELKKLGFNMLRKHIKIEPLRWYYHCDRLGMLVWQDFVSGGGPYRSLVTQALPFVNVRLNDKRYGIFGRKDEAGRYIFERDMSRTVSLLYNAACIAVWVPFNEGWGQFDACRIAGRLRKLDPTRLIDHASGWHDQMCGDFISRHIYYKKFKMEKDPQDRVQALSEFGGYSCPSAGHMASASLFGYRMYKDKAELTAAFEKLYLSEVLPAVQKGLAACVYTQVSDVEDEINGIFTYDRAELKLDAETVRRINEELRKAGGGAV
jgi:hypothetical protein